MAEGGGAPMPANSPSPPWMMNGEFGMASRSIVRVIFPVDCANPTDGIAIASIAPAASAKSTIRALRWCGESSNRFPVILSSPHGFDLVRERLMSRSRSGALDSTRAQSGRIHLARRRDRAWIDGARFVASTHACTRNHSTCLEMRKSIEFDHSTVFSRNPKRRPGPRVEAAAIPSPRAADGRSGDTSAFSRMAAETDTCRPLVT